jgi:hypothetical protein
MPHKEHSMNVQRGKAAVAKVPISWSSTSLIDFGRVVEALFGEPADGFVCSDEVSDMQLFGVLGVF